MVDPDVELVMTIEGSCYITPYFPGPAAPDAPPEVGDIDLEFEVRGKGSVEQPLLAADKIEEAP